MRCLRCFFAFLTAAVCAVLLYCLYLRFPNPLTQALAPRSACPWELSKLAYWSMLPAGILLHRMEPDSARGGLCAAVLLAAAGAVLLGMTGAAPVMVCLTAFAVSLAAYALILRRIRSGELLWYTALILLAIAYILFSILPPSGALFTDPADVSVIAPIPF